MDGPSQAVHDTRPVEVDPAQMGVLQGVERSARAEHAGGLGARETPANPVLQFSLLLPVGQGVPIEFLTILIG